MGHNNVILGHPKSTVIPRVDELSTRPPNLGCHRDDEIRVDQLKISMKTSKSISFFILHMKYYKSF